MGSRRALMLATSCLVVGVCSVAVAVPLLLDNVAANLLGDGGFEAGSLSLSPPPSGPTPLIVGGWAAHGAREPRILTSVQRARSGSSSVRITSRGRRHSAMVQDVPLGSTAFLLTVAVYRERGTQVVSLLSDWDRESSVPLDGDLTAFVGDVLVLATPGGVYESGVRVPADRWFLLGLRTDPRARTVTLEVDGEPAFIVHAPPGLDDLPEPTTLFVGGIPGDHSRFRYDDVSLQRLADVELATIRAAVERLVEQPDAGLLATQLDAAAIALSRPAPRLAAPELRAARRALSSLPRDRTPPVGDERGGPGIASLDALEIAISHLLELLSATS